MEFILITVSTPVTVIRVLIPVYQLDYSGSFDHIVAILNSITDRVNKSMEITDVDFYILEIIYLIAILTSDITISCIDREDSFGMYYHKLPQLPEPWRLIARGLRVS